MKTIKITWQHIMIALGVIIVAVLLRVFIGVNVWLTLGLVALFGVCSWLKDQAQIDSTRPETMTKTNKGMGTFASIAQFAVIVVFSASILIAFLPRSNQGRKVAIANTDRFFARLMGNKTKSQANDIWDIQARKAGKTFLSYYNHLLELGLTKEAADTLAGFNEHWNTDLLKDEKNEAENEKQSFSSSKVGQQTKILPSVSSNNPGFDTESYTFTKEGETWFPEHSFEKGEKIIYTIENYSAILVDRDGTKHFLSPGKYGGPMIEAGPPIFLGQLAGSKITVYYNII